MEQSLGYAAAVGTIVMDELASVCGRAEVRFTRVRTDLGIVENDIAIVKDQVTLGARAYGNGCLHVGNISGFGRKFLQCSCQIHFIHISNVMSTCASNVIADNISFTFEM